MYRKDGNDPNRKDHDLSPEEVKQMIRGGGALFDGAEKGGAYQVPDRPLWEDINGVRFVDFAHTDVVYAVPRCLTCGRTFDCACTDCDFCDANGRPLPELFP